MFCFDIKEFSDYVRTYVYAITMSFLRNTIYVIIAHNYIVMHIVYRKISIA